LESFTEAEDVGLEFKASGHTVGHNNFSDLEHLFVNFRVVLEELFCSLEVAKTLVDVQLMKERVESCEANVTKLASVNMHGEPVFAFGGLAELNLDYTGSIFSHACKDNPSSPDMGLAPKVLLLVEKLKALDGRVEHLQPAGVENVVPFGFTSRKEDLEWPLQVDEMQSDRVGTAFFVARVKLSKFLAPRFRGRVSVLHVDGLLCEGVQSLRREVRRLALIIQRIKLASTMSE